MVSFLHSKPTTKAFHAPTFGALTNFTTTYKSKFQHVEKNGTFSPEKCPYHHCPYSNVNQRDPSIKAPVLQGVWAMT